MSTLDARQLRTAILASWDRVDGGRLIDELAQKDPHAYLKLVVSVLPRNLELEVDAGDRALTIADAVLLLEKHDHESGRGRLFGGRSVHVPRLANDQTSD